MTAAHDKENAVQYIFDATVELARSHASNPAHPIPIIAIGGCSGVGKTHLTDVLQERLREAGTKVTVLRLDDFILPRGQLKDIDKIPHPNVHPNFDGKQAQRVLSEIKSDTKSIRQPMWDRTKDEHVTVEVTVCYEHVDVILMEGVYALEKNVYGLSNFSDLRVFIDAPIQVIYEWMCHREAQKKQPRPKELFDKDIAWDLEDYQKVIAPSKAEAHVIVTKDSSHKLTLQAKS